MKENWPLFAQIPQTEKKLLLQRMALFLKTKQFEACGDLEEVTDSMRILIAAQASLLILHKPLGEGYEDLRSILIYPDAFKGSGDDDSQLRLGESWGTGSVILSWRSVKQGAQDDDDGRNVVFHEFAHQLDQSTYHADGVPDLETRQDYKRWSAAFAPAYEKFINLVEKGRRTVIDPYGATNEAEFFSVLTETFLEKPHQLNEKYPDVYHELSRYYQIDPLSWSGMND